MTKYKIFDILDAHKGAEYSDHAELVPVIDYIKLHDPSSYESMRRLLNRVYLQIGAEIASEVRAKRQLKINFDEEQIC